jgi:hypothetical protein
MLRIPVISFKLVIFSSVFATVITHISNNANIYYGVPFDLTGMGDHYTIPPQLCLKIITIRAKEASLEVRTWFAVLGWG